MTIYWLLSRRYKRVITTREKKHRSHTKMKSQLLLLAVGITAQLYTTTQQPLTPKGDRHIRVWSFLAINIKYWVSNTRLLGQDHPDPITLFMPNSFQVLFWEQNHSQVQNAMNEDVRNGAKSMAVFPHQASGWNMKAALIRWSCQILKV